MAFRLLQPSVVSWPPSPIPGRRVGGLGILLVGLLLCVPSEGGAQWISSPGDGWLDVSLIYHDTDQVFDETGERRTIFAQGRAVALSLFFVGNMGIWDGVDLWAEVPVHRIRFDDAGGQRTSMGVGDSRLFVRVGPELVGLPPFPLALRGGVKMAGGSFDIDAEVIPLGEGQRDLELILEAGRSFHPRSLWTMGWVGHRWREENVVANRTPGNEWFWWWSIGGELGPVGWEGSVEGLRGDPWVLEGGLRLPSTRRQLDQILAQVNHPLGPGHGQLGVRVPLSGQNLPAGLAITLGYFLQWQR